MYFKWCSAVGLLCLLVACGGGGAPAADNPGTGDVLQGNFLPLGAGNRWVYQYGVANALEVVAVVGNETVAGAPGVRTRRIKYSEARIDTVVERADQLLVATAEAVTQHTGADGDPVARAVGPVLVLRYPLREGASFVQADQRIDGLVDADFDGVADRATLRSVVTVVGLETIVVPAGRFEGALHLRTEVTTTIILSRSGRSVQGLSVGDDWLAPDIGPVRSDLELRGETGVISSESKRLLHYKVGGRRSDAEAPVASDPQPAEGSTLPGGLARPSVLVSEASDPESAQTALQVFDAAGQPVAGQVISSRGGLHFEPAVPLPSGAYEARLGSTLTDLAGNALANPLRWRFSVDASGPQLSASTPADGAVDVAIDSMFVLDFNEPLADSSVQYDAVALYRAGNDTAVRARVEVDGGRVSLIPLGPLERGKAYELRIAARVRDLYSQVFGANRSLFFTTAAGRFGVPQRLAIDMLASAVGDVNGDGRNDLVYTAWVSSEGFNVYGLFLQLQGADGKLGAPVDTGWRRGSQHSCLGIWPVVADLNGDGRLDIALDHGECGIQRWFQGADGRLLAAPALPGSGFGALLAQDLDGDRRTDLVRLSGMDSVQRWQQQADGSMLQLPDVALGLGNVRIGRGFSVADVDGDGRVDMVVPVAEDETGRSRVRVLRQAADGSFSTAQDFYVSFDRLMLVDLDGDGRAELVLVDVPSQAAPQLQVYAWVASSGFAWRRSIDLSGQPRALAAADLDGDGRMDLLASRDGWVDLYLQRSDGGFGAAESYHSEYAYTSDFHSSRLDGDALPDIVLGGWWLRQLPGAAPAGALQSALGRLRLRGWLR